MAGPLAAIERFFERVFERPPARLFAPRLEREYLQRELIRTMEAERDVRSRRTYVPTHYRIQFNGADLATLAGQPTLAADLAEGLRVHARTHGYLLGGRPSVVFDRSTTLEPSEVAVVADEPVVPSTNGRRPHAQRPSTDGRAAAESGRPNGAEALDVGNTATFEATRPNAPRATLSVHVPGRVPWRINISSGRLRVGRALDNDLVLADDRVSRHHGQVSVRFGTLVYADLGSTNGSFVNGVRVSEIALGPGDVLQLGGSALTVEPGQ